MLFFFKWTMAWQVTFCADDGAPPMSISVSSGQLVRVYAVKRSWIVSIKPPISTKSAYLAFCTHSAANCLLYHHSVSFHSLCLSTFPEHVKCTHTLVCCKIGSKTFFSRSRFNPASVSAKKINIKQKNKCSNPLEFQNIAEKAAII